MKLVRKLFTKPFWYWETKRSYPIRNKIFTLPSCHTPNSFNNALAILTTADTICDAAWCAQSFLSYLPSDLGIFFIIDHSLETLNTKALNQLFPNAQIISTQQLVQKMAPLMPHTAKLAHYPQGRKLISIAALQQKYHILYSDFDILCFNPIPEINTAIKENSPFYLQCVANVCTDATVLEKTQKLELEYAKTINAGLLFIPKNSLDLQIPENILKEIDTPLTWFWETVVLAVLMEQINAHPLPKKKYVVCNQRQFYWEQDVSYKEISLRHFTTPVRHVMYGKAMPYLWKQISDFT